MACNFGGHAYNENLLYIEYDLGGQMSSRLTSVVKTKVKYLTSVVKCQVAGPRWSELILIKQCDLGGLRENMTSVVRINTY